VSENMILRPEHNSKESIFVLKIQEKIPLKHKYSQPELTALILGSQGLPLYAGLTVHKIDLLAS
jgi:hypothetical protein